MVRSGFGYHFVATKENASSTFVTKHKLNTNKVVAKNRFFRESVGPNDMKKSGFNMRRVRAMNSKTSQQTITDTWQIQKAAPVLGPRRFFLSFHCRAGVKVIELADGESYVVGRAFPSELTLDDPSLSRQHARFRCHRGTVAVQDLNSRNGILIRDERVSKAIVSSGDALALGGVTVVVYSVGLDKTSERGIATYDRLLERLDDEIIRSRQFGRSFAIAIIRSSINKEAYVTQFWNRVRDSLRAIDTLAPYGAFSLLVLLPEASSQEASEWANNLVVNSDDTSDIECGLAVYPFAGTSAETLIASAHDACRSATKKNPVRMICRDQNRAKVSDTEVVIQSEKMRDVQQLVDRVAESPIPVLIQGETGSGKEVVARAIHQRSDRKNKRFLAVNCAAIPNTLIESTLFGHMRGSFTGAHRNSPGVFEQANKGTVFLDEIGELALPAQAALLRVLESKRLVRIGGTHEIEVDIRVIAASHCDLESMVEQGTFRQDLLYRLNTLVVQVPPLRERVDDIKPLVALFLRQISEEWGRPNVKLHPDALEAMRHYRWPGNVRQLRNVVERAIIVCPGDTIHLTDIPETILSAARRSQLNAREKAGSTHDGVEEPFGSLKDQMHVYEIAIIKRAMSRAQGKRRQAAELLGIPVRTLNYKLREYEIEQP